ncbi:MAG: radical SAM protein, partial [bacterium]|nr:radical SAM protein [bacterium]
DKSVFGRGYRFQSTGRVLAELDELVHRYGIKDVAFVDSLFFHNESKIFDFAEALRKKRWDLTWTCSMHVNRVNRELLELMKAAGCWRIRIGIESGCQEVLDFIHKKTKLEKIKQVARWADKLDLKTKAFIMVGHLIDTRNTIEESINFVRQLPLKDITVQINTPMLNTPQYEMAPQYGRLQDYSPEHLNYWEPVFVSNSLTSGELLAYQKKFYRSFYFRPDVIWRHLRDIKSLRDLWRYIRSAGLLMSLFFTRKAGGR